MSTPRTANEGRTPPAWLHTWRLPVMVVALLVILVVAQQLTVLLSGTGLLGLVVGVAAAAATLFCYVRLTRFVERRPSVPELPRDRARPGLLWGSAIGTATFLVTLLIMLVFGGADFSGGDAWKFLATLGMMACVAVTEEVIFRGVLFRVVEGRFGSWAALGVSSVLFGALHLAGASEVSAGAMLWGAFSIVLQGGIMLGAAYLASRTLWFPIGLHFAWNAVEAALGTAVSGKSSDLGGLVQTTLTGPSALTGGSFGPEAGLAATAACLLLSALLLRSAKRHGRLVPATARQR
ncbi:CPBP family intramembrane glutamic endopeptidase [Amycolatopsis sacchari]|uniref:CAAX prenyl protease 2/Lysostaphin resistance protein A-like domain-containing protein n=1 Tax=Amycolatopsis sacchari TaxID=115433 RepID=A0A1I3RAD5_9PSEU|nr:CPBP family intramembrane glutamic endopeptidase [Amycolatopsis sacchari]SFJ43020.1 hypothetical protein SAMN05421835_105211 [Amycolatopsis sacchari]